MAKAQVRLLCFLYFASLLFVIVTSSLGDRSEPIPDMVENAPKPIDDITCSEAAMDLLPCLPFLKGSEPSPTESCCQGVQTVQKMANTTQIRRDLCECLKKAAPGLGIDPARAKLIPQYCHIELPVPIDPNVDCSKIPYERHQKLEA